MCTYTHICIYLCMHIYVKNEYFRPQILHLTFKFLYVVPEIQNNFPMVKYLMNDRAGVRTSIS